MEPEELGHLSFVSWLRRGLASEIQRDANSVANVPQTEVLVDVDFSPTAAPGTLSTTPKLTLVGPGDIVGLDSRVVVRLWPNANENDAESENFALIEFDQADLPWRYTPSKENAQGQVRPWFNLVVIKETEGNLEPPTPERKIAVLNTNTQHLPNLVESWAWAHTQFEGDSFNEEKAKAQVNGAPGLFTSRVICPRKLETNTRYIACLVPTFLRGVVVGLGRELERLSEEGANSIDALELAWQPNTSGEIQLPVYFQWRFQTGAIGSFEQLARLIEPQPVPASVGRRKIDVRTPGLSLPPVSEQVLEVEGALQSVQAAQAGPVPWPDADRAAWIQGLKQFLNDPEVPLAGGDTARVVAPPLYGRWYAAQAELDEARPNGNSPPWFADVNEDARLRVGAGLGTVVIQQEQQALLASGWSQVEEVETINSKLRSMQLGREVWTRLFNRHVKPGYSDTFWAFTSKLHYTIDCGGRSVCQQFKGSPVGLSAFEPGWGRLLRPGGRLGTRQGQLLLPADFQPSWIERLNMGQVPAPEPLLPEGLFTPQVILGGFCFEDVRPADIDKLKPLGPQLLLFWGLVLMYTGRKLLIDRQGDCWWWALRLIRFGIGLIRLAHDPKDAGTRIDWCLGDLTCEDILNSPKNPSFTPFFDVPDILPLPPVLDLAGTVDSPDAVLFRDALCDLLDDDLKPPPLIPVPPPVNLDECKDAVDAALDPEVTIPERAGPQVKLDPSVSWDPLDPLDPIFAPPEYERPMYEPLKEVSDDWILPGLSQVVRNSAGIVFTNQRFIEAYMLGLNEEMSRELLWNEFPTDQRGTYFRQFWDVAGFVAAPASPVPAEQLRDILPIRQWSKDARLGENSPRPVLDGGAQRLVVLLRAQLIQRYPNLIVYAVPAVSTPAGRRPSDDAELERYPVLYGLLEPDVAFYGFELTLEEVRSDPGWFFYFAEQPGEPKFEALGAPGGFVTPPAATSAAVAENRFRQPFRLAVHGSQLLPEG